MISMSPERTSPTAAALADQLRPVLLRLSRELRREAQSLGVTGGQVALLIQIKRNPGITASALAERERMSAPGMSGHIARLENAKLIERTRAEDRRRIGLTITPAGEKILASVRKRRTAWLAEHLKELSASERQSIARALPALEKLLEVRTTS
jgi:DNA-binding MarR family transcriptional regulator